MATAASEVMARGALTRDVRDVRSRHEPAWKLGFQSLEDEVKEPRPLEVNGTIPRDLSGTLYRIGPARHDVYGERFRHWFDGDGMVHALALDGGAVTYMNRFVETPGKLEEDRAHKRLYRGFGTRTPGGPLARFLRRNDDKNPANTNIVFHGGKLLALCEGGRPYRLDPETLETLGEDDMSGVLAPDAMYSAHPKLDPRTGEMWNFGAVVGAKPGLVLYRTTAKGVTTRVAEVGLPAFAMVHDFALTDTKAIFVIAPVVLPRIPVALLLGQRSFGESIAYRPELGVTIVVVDRATGDARRHKTEPFMMFHVVNAWDEGEDVVVDVAAYPDGRILQTLVDVMAGDTPSVARAWAERLRITRERAVTRTRLSDVPIEFPRVAGRALGREHTRIYGVAWAEGMDFIGRPIAIDTKTGKASEARFGAGELAGECVPVTKAGGTTESDVWLLTLGVDGIARTSELRILDGADSGAPPVATVRLPHVVPFGFHGNWVRRAS